MDYIQNKEKRKVGRPRIKKPDKDIKLESKQVKVNKPILQVIYKKICFNIIDD